MRNRFVKLWSFFLLIGVFSISGQAQESAKYELQMKRLAGMIRMKADIMRISEPLLYLGFHNSDASFKLDELAMERSFIVKFSSIIVCNPNQDFEASQKFDASLFDEFEPSLQKFKKLLIEPEQYSYVIFGDISPTEEEGKIEIRAGLYNLELDELVAEYSMTCRR